MVLVFINVTSLAYQEEQEEEGGEDDDERGMRTSVIRMKGKGIKVRGGGTRDGWAQTMTVHAEVKRILCRLRVLRIRYTGHLIMLFLVKTRTVAN